MSVLPFAPGVLPGMAPGGAGGAGSQLPASTADVAPDAGGASADSPVFPDPGAEFAAALTAALMGVPTPPAPTDNPLPAAPLTSPDPGSGLGAAGASSPDEPAVIGGPTGTVRAVTWQSPGFAATIAVATTTDPAAGAADAVPSGPVRTAPPATVATGAAALSAGEEPVPGPPTGPADAATAPAPASPGEAPARAPRNADSDPEPRQLEATTLPVRHPNPAGSSGTVTPAAMAGMGGGVSGAAQDPVVRQVLPAVLQLATKGSGTHRISVTLQPEHLGEVRVTMVVRDGEVRVSLAADSRTTAKDVLLQGAPELRRLLEATGATDTRVVVRDLPPTSATPTASSAPTDRGFGDRGFGDRAPGNPDDRPHGHGDSRRGGDDHTGDERRGAVPPIQRAAATTSATPTTGRLDRTV